MTIKDLLRRLDRIEAGNRTEAPTAVFSAVPLTDELRAELSDDWRKLVDAGRASINGNMLFVRGPQLSAKEWNLQTAKQRGEPFH